MTVVIDTPEGISVFQALSIRGMIKLSLVGLKPRGRMTDILYTASTITGKGPYKTSPAGKQKAIDDLSVWIEEMKSARG